MNVKVTAANNPSTFGVGFLDVIYRQVDGSNAIVPNGIKKILTTSSNPHAIGTIHNILNISTSEPIIMESYTPIVTELKINFDQESVLSRTIEANETNPVIVELLCFVTALFDGDTNDIEIDFVGTDTSVTVVLEAGEIDLETLGLQGQRTIRITKNGKLSLQYSNTGSPSDGQLTVVAKITTIQ